MNRFLQDFPTTGRAPDALKAIAATLMVVDHVNAIFLGGIPLLWVMGRAVFPLFCFIVALHLSRGVDGFDYFKKLLPFAVLAQIPHTWVLWDTVMGSDIHNFFINVIFTLALGGFVASFVLKLENWMKCALLGVAVAGEPVFGYLEFGLIGVLMPAFFLMVIKEEKGGWILLLLTFFFLNHDFSSMGFDWVMNGAYFVIAAMYTILTLWIIYEVSKYRDGKRFLPKYFLHFFYPGHFVVLGLLNKFL